VAPGASAPPVAGAGAVPPVRIEPDRRPDPEPPLAASGAATSTPAAPAPATPPPVKRVPAPPAPVEEPGLLESLTTDNPLLLPGAGGLLALLLGYAAWRLRGRFGRRKDGANESAAFAESRLQRDSLFSATGGGRVDTQEGMSRLQGSSIGYSLSQLDAIGDVDPVAEADVYLAYGRDLQAEEILKEAMRAHPERLAIKTKLLEVYAKRRDVRAHEVLAAQVYVATGGQGEDWEKVQEQGGSIDPDNPLYQPGGKPDTAPSDATLPMEPLGAPTVPHTAPAQPLAFEPAPDATLDSIDLDLDIGGEEPLKPGESTQPLALQPELAQPFGNDEATISLEPKTVPVQRPAPPEMDDVPPTVSLGKPPAPAEPPGGLDFDLGALPDELSPTAAPAPADAGASSLLDFGDFGLEPPAAPADDSGDGPLARKLELAEEFRQIGDHEGARDLLEEVVSKAEGSLKAKAQGMLEKLG
jgi:pilus assembly protein FimV